MLNAAGSHLGQLLTVLAFGAYMALAGLTGSGRVVAVVHGRPVKYGEIRADARAVSASFEKDGSARVTLRQALARAHDLEEARLADRLVALSSTTLTAADVDLKDRRYAGALVKLPIR